MFMATGAKNKLRVLITVNIVNYFFQFMNKERDSGLKSLRSVGVSSCRGSDKKSNSSS